MTSLDKFNSLHEEFSARDFEGEYISRNDSIELFLQKLQCFRECYKSLRSSHTNIGSRCKHLADHLFLTHSFPQTNSIYLSEVFGLLKNQLDGSWCKIHFRLSVLLRISASRDDARR